MKLINVDELIMQLPDDLPYKSSVSKVLAQAQELHIFKCPNCGCGIIIIHDGKADEDLYCPYCKEKLNQEGKRL